MNCRSGYTGENTDSDITFHSFPLHNEELLQKWLQRLAKKDFVPTKYSRVCSLHFKLGDFITESNDQQNRRKKKRSTIILVKQRLKSDAIPSIFKNLPSYYASKDPPSRSGKAASTSRYKNEAARLEENCVKFLDADKVTNYDEFTKKIVNEVAQQGYLIHHTKDGLSLIYVTEQQPPSMLASVFVSEGLEVIVYYKQKRVPQSSYQHIMTSDKVTLYSQMANLMAFAKNKQPSEVTSEEFQLSITDLINKFLSNAESEHELQFLKFIDEQIELGLTNKHPRRYSPEILMMSYGI